MEGKVRDARRRHAVVVGFLKIITENHFCFFFFFCYFEASSFSFYLSVFFFFSFHCFRCFSFSHSRCSQLCLNWDSCSSFDMFTLEAPALLFLAFGSVPALAAGGLEPTVACVKNGTLADDDFFLQTRGGFAANPEIGTSWKQHAQCAPTEVSLDRTGSKHMWALQWGRAFLFDGDSTQCNSQWTSLPPAPTNLTTISGSGTAAFVADVNRKVYQLIGASVSNPGGTAWAEMSLPAAGTATALALSSDQRLFVAADHQNEKVGATTSLFQASSSDNYSTFEILNPQPPESIGDIIHLAANSNQLVGLGDTGIIAKFSLSARKASSPGWITLNNVSTPLASVDIDSEGTIWGSTPEGAVLHLPAGASQAEWKIVSKPSELVCIRITASATLAPNSLLPRPSLLSPISGFLNPVRLATSATIVDSSTIPSDVVKDASARYAKLLGLTAADAPNKVCFALWTAVTTRLSKTLLA